MKMRIVRLLAGFDRIMAIGESVFDRILATEEAGFDGILATEEAGFDGILATEEAGFDRFWRLKISKRRQNSRSLLACL
jgi:hypothetical protein